jgi:SEC-C motif-containing protein
MGRPALWTAVRPPTFGTLAGVSLAPACPCGTGRSYAACCGPLHDGETAPTAEALMRSRYSAYVRGLDDYVFRTWHPRTRPPSVSSEVAWTGLTVVRTSGGGVHDERGVVEFVATAPDQRLHEVSRFERRGGRWVYLDDDVAAG